MNWRRTYTADTLRADLAEFEATYGMSSEVFFAVWTSSDVFPTPISLHDAFVWADLYREWRRLASAGR